MNKYKKLISFLILIFISTLNSFVLAKSSSSIPQINDPALLTSATTSTNPSLDETQRLAMIEQVDNLYWQGHYQEALDLYKQLSTDYSPQNTACKLHWLSTMADCYCRLNDYKQAEQLYTQILESKKESCRQQPVHLAEPLTDLAACNYYLKEYNKAEAYCRKGLALLENTNDFLLLAKTHLELAEILYQRCKYKNATKQYTFAISYYDKLYNLSREDIIEPLMVALEGAGACYYVEKQYQSAKPCYDRLATLQRNIFGDEDVRYGWSLVTMSDIDQKLGQDQLSESLYEKSVWIFRKANKDRLISEFEKQGKLTPEIAQTIERYVYGNSDQTKAKSGDSVLAKGNDDTTILQCLPAERSMVKPGPWNLVTTAELDPPGWVWIDPTKPLHGVVICVHGLGLNARSYNAFAKGIIPSGYMVIAFHVRGFGSYVASKGGEKVNFQQCLNDLATVLRIIDKDNKGLPVFLVGESMGGAIALQLTAIHPELVSGLVCSVPAGSRYNAPSIDFDVALHIVKGMNKPFDIGTKIVNQATKETNLKKDWQSDPFNRLSLAPKELLQFAQFMSQNKTAATKIKNTPVIVFQGVQDKLVKPKGTMEIYNLIASTDKDLVLIGSSEHLIFENNACDKSVISGIVGWMQAHNSNVPGTFN